MLCHLKKNIEKSIIYQQKTKRITPGNNKWKKMEVKNMVNIKDQIKKIKHSCKCQFDNKIQDRYS